jgi:hypothetical protein
MPLQLAIELVMVLPSQESQHDRRPKAPGPRLPQRRASRVLPLPQPGLIAVEGCLMEGGITARPLDYFALLVGASIVALFSAVSGDPLRQVRQVRGEEACVVLGSMLFWLCTGRRVLLGEVGVKSGISIFALLLTGHSEKGESFCRNEA